MDDRLVGSDSKGRDRPRLAGGSHPRSRLGPSRLGRSHLDGSDRGPSPHEPVQITVYETPPARSPRRPPAPRYLRSILVGAAAVGVLAVVGFLARSGSIQPETDPTLPTNPPQVLGGEPVSLPPSRSVGPSATVIYPISSLPDIPDVPPLPVGSAPDVTVDRPGSRARLVVLNNDGSLVEVDFTTGDATTVYQFDREHLRPPITISVGADNTVVEFADRTEVVGSQQATTKIAVGSGQAATWQGTDRAGNAWNYRFDPAAQMVDAVDAAGAHTEIAPRRTRPLSDVFVVGTPSGVYRIRGGAATLLNPGELAAYGPAVVVSRTAPGETSVESLAVSDIDTAETSGTISLPRTPTPSSTTPPRLGSTSPDGRWWATGDGEDVDVIPLDGDATSSLSVHLAAESSSVPQWDRSSSLVAWVVGSRVYVLDVRSGDVATADFGLAAGSSPNPPTATSELVAVGLG